MEPKTSEPHTLLLDPSEALYVLIDMTGSMLIRDIGLTMVGHVTRIAAAQLALRSLLSSPHAVPTSKLRVLGVGADVRNTSTPGSPVDVLDMLRPCDAELRLLTGLSYVETMMHEERYTRAAVLVVLDGEPNDCTVLEALDQHSDAYALHVFNIGPDAIPGAASFLDASIRWATSRPTQPSLPPVAADDEALTTDERDATRQAMLDAVATSEHVEQTTQAALTSDADREHAERASTEPPRPPPAPASKKGRR